MRRSRRVRRNGRNDLDQEYAWRELRHRPGRRLAVDWSERRSLSTGIGSVAHCGSTRTGAPRRGRHVPRREGQRSVDAGGVDADRVAGRALLIGCTPGNGADNPHYTTPDVSGHGTYGKGTCTNNTANVYNCLYEWYTDNTWRQKKCSSTVTVTAGGGSGNRSNARHVCHSTSQLISWRNHEDVHTAGHGSSRPRA